MSTPTFHTAGTGSSVVVSRCQVCDSTDLRSAMFLGYLPPVNQMRPIGQRPAEQPAYPAELLFCPKCQLVQLGLVVDPAILFPPEYPYTSGTTRILRENFAELAVECGSLLALKPDDLVVDIGSNDGTLLSNFGGRHRVQGIEPTDVGRLALTRNIPTEISFFNRPAVEKVLAAQGQAALITATNVFAHIEDVHQVLDNLLSLLAPQGVFISESHYLISLLETLQYDTIYHEHLRYYSLTSLAWLLNRHDLEVIHARRISTHGGSIRVYAARRGTHPVRPSVQEILAQEAARGPMEAQLADFRRRAVLSKAALYGLIELLLRTGGRIYGIGAPSRASTLIHYVGLNDSCLDCVLEVPGSLKVGKYMPGTIIPVVDETRLLSDPPEAALLLSWHIAEELIPKLRAKGYANRFLIPLPTPQLV